MKNLKLIYFEGCPNYQAAVDLLESLNVEFESINQDKLKENSPLKSYSFPTLLKGEEIIFGSMASGGGCSLRLPAKEELSRLLK